MQDMLFSKEQFDRLFPFYILINNDLSINSCGSTIEKLCSSCQGSDFSNCFELSRPVIDEINFDSIKSLCGQLVVLHINNKHKNFLRGQFEHLSQDNQLLFIGSPWFNAIEQVTESDLSLNDFAVHDPLIDLLHVLKTQEIVNEDLKPLVSIKK